MSTSILPNWSAATIRRGHGFRKNQRHGNWKVWGEERPGGEEEPFWSPPVPLSLALRRTPLPWQPCGGHADRTDREVAIEL
jgi:hypothetical protein